MRRWFASLLALGALVGLGNAVYRLYQPRRSEKRGHHNHPLRQDRIVVQPPGRSESFLRTTEPEPIQEVEEQTSSTLRDAWSWILALVFPAALLSSWSAAFHLGWLPPQLVAPPTDVAVALGRLANDGTLLEHTLASVQRVALGFGIGAAAGVAVGLWTGASRLGEKLLGPTLQTLGPVPPIAWTPLLIIAFGIGETPKVALVAIGVFFVMAIQTTQGVRGTNERYVELARLYRIPRLNLLRSVLVPSALPSVLTGARVALALAWILLIAAEMIDAAKGLGWLIQDSRGFSRPDEMIAGMVMIGLLGKGTDMAIAATQAHLLRWDAQFTGL